MACLKFSELSKELNKHFSNNKDEQGNPKFSE